MIEKELEKLLKEIVGLLKLNIQVQNQILREVKNGHIEWNKSGSN